MSAFVKFFKEFRSIFETENILKENEEHANIVTATTMFNLSLICLLTWILVKLNVFKVDSMLMNITCIFSFLLLTLPAVICFIIKGKGKWIKNILFGCFTIMIAIADVILKNNITLIMVLPIILSSRYYTKKFTMVISLNTVVFFMISTYIGLSIGHQDINTYNLIIPQGTTITVDGQLRDAISKVEIDESQRIKNTYIHFFIPKLFIYSMVAFACVQVSQSGKKMLEKQKKLSEDGARIESELNIANAIQKNMLPSIFPPFPDYKEFDIYASMEPAKEVGGDFYDMFLIDKNHLGIGIADVSGKGVPAALIMMITKTLIKNTALNGYEINEVFNRVNNLLCEKNALNHFVTGWYGILDLQTGKLEFVNAGHNPPIIFTKKNNNIEFLKTKPNFVLAGMENTNYKKHEIILEPGDRLFLYTDGVTEATNINNELYGENRLKDFLSNHINQDVEKTIKDLKNDIENFVGDADQFDDITMLEFLFKEKKGDDV